MRAEDVITVKVVVKGDGFVFDGDASQNVKKGTTIGAVLGNPSSKEDYLSYEGNNKAVDYLLNDAKEWQYVDTKISVYSSDGTSKIDISGASDPLSATLQENCQVVIEVTPDAYKSESLVAHPGNVDYKSDLELNILSYSVEKWSLTDEKPTGTYTDVDENSMILVADREDISSKVKSWLPNYGVEQEDADGNVYRLVFYYTGDLEDVTSDITIKGVWTKDAKELLVNGKAPTDKPAQVYDELDTNHDGVVSCDEAHGEGWVWNEDKKACVYTGSTTSTVIVNTATK